MPQSRRGPRLCADHHGRNVATTDGARHLSRMGINRALKQHSAMIGESDSSGGKTVVVSSFDGATQKPEFRVSPQGTSNHDRHYPP